MDIYKPKDFADKINVTVNTLQRWDREGTLKADRSPTNRRFYTNRHYKQYLNNINKYNDKYIEESKNIEVDIRLRKENSIFIVEIQNIKTKEYVEMYRTTSYEHSIDLANKYIKDFNMIGIDINVTNDIK